MDGEELKTEEEPAAKKVALTENKTEPKDTGGCSWEKEKKTRSGFQAPSEPQPQ